MALGTIIKKFRQKPPLGSQINWGHPLSKGLVGCWLMNEGRGNKINEIVKGKPATNVGGTWIAGLNYQQLKFGTLSGKYVNCGNVGEFSGNQTIFIMFNWDGSSNGTHRLINRPISDSTGSDSSYSVVLYSGTTLKFDVETSSIGTYKSASTAISAGYHKLFCINNMQGTVDIILNNKRTVGDSWSGGSRRTDNTFNTYFSRWNSTYEQNWVNSISYVCMWNRILSPSEIRQLYAEPYCFINPPTVWSKFKTAVEAVIDNSQYWIM